MIYDTLKGIKIIRIFILCFYIFCFYSNVFAQDSLDQSSNNFKDIVNHFYTSVSASDFTDNDSLIPYKTRSMIILDYLNIMLNKILASNKELLSQYGLDEKDIKIQFNLRYSTNASVNHENILRISISEYDLTRKFIYNSDAFTIAVLSHEIAHMLLGHAQIINDIAKKVLYEFITQPENNIKIENMDTKTYEEIYKELSPEDAKNFHKILKTNEDFIRSDKQGEIEADNLGLLLYLNTEFNVTNYTNHLLYVGLYQNRRFFHGDPWWLQFYMLKDYLIKKYQRLPYPTDDIEKIRSTFTRYLEKIDEKIEKDKYAYGYLNALENKLFSPIPDSHPIALWRFWNILKQEQKLSQDVINKTDISTTEYVRIDLSRFDGLDNIKDSLSNKKYRSSNTFNISNKKDPRFHILEAIFNDNPTISYQFFSSLSPIESIGIIQSDNTIVLKANDFFKAASLSLAEEINTLGISNPCAKLFIKKSYEIRRTISNEISEHMIISTTILMIITKYLNSLIFQI